MTIKDAPAYLVSGVSAQTVGDVLDCRTCLNYAYLYYQAAGESAIFTLQASHDASAWLPVATYTATATQSASAQLAAFYPYVRATVGKLYSGGGNTGVLSVYYAPGLQRRT